MPKYLTSLSQIISLMDFLSEVSTLYRVEPGPEFRLVASNLTAEAIGAGSKNLYGRLLKDIVPKDDYLNIIFPLFEKAARTKEVCRSEQLPPYPASTDVMDVLLTPVVENEDCTHIWVITKYRRSQEELEHFAFHDFLTGAPNRRFFLQRLNKALSRYQQHDMKCALMLVDCDNFKQINDSMGHDIGDQFIQEVAERLKSCIGEAFVARLGGDEFVILLEDWQTDQTVIQTADQVLHKLQVPWHINDYVLNTTVSIGISIINLTQDIESIISSADKALYKAKSKGGNNYVIFNAI
jgi:diguanylate cyclase (GGDEF)-like protein